MSKRPDTIDAEFVVKGFACFSISSKHKNGKMVGRIYHSRDAAEQCVELYKKSAKDDEQFILREIQGYE